MHYSPNNRLRLLSGAVDTPSGTKPTIFVTQDEGHRLKVLIVGAEGEHWEETWDVISRAGPTAKLWRQSHDGDLSQIDVALKG